MNAFQNSFKYEGDLRKTPVKNINLVFKTPVFDYYKTTDNDNEKIDRKINRTESVTIEKDLKSKDYSVQLHEDFITEKGNANSINFQNYLKQSVESKSLDNFSVTLEVDFYSDTNKVGSKSFNIIYFLNYKAQENTKLKTRSLFEVDVDYLILINKDSYFNLLQKLSKYNQSNDDFSLLEIILSLYDFNNPYPFLLKKIPDETRRKIIQLFATDNPEPLEIIVKNFPDLFDFPISVPEIKLLEASGTFTVVTNDNSKITKKELSYYDLLLQYAKNEINSYEIVHFDLSTASSRIQNNGIGFSFTEDKKIILNNIQDMVSIQVKGFDGSLLWSKQYQPDAPELKEIKIEVPLIKPVTLTTSDKKNTPDINKKLRGQVVVYNKDCTLKDIIVVVKAKKDGDTVWTIVGSAKTDNSGNFFMPYPFGQYTDAQAIVSLTQNDPVAIQIIKGDENNQTISDDFLYLLVTNADCLPDKNNEKCDCDSPKKASRLPDHNDLIQSDEYSQDLGGSCINLSTPNRTLSEYSYQAIVRTSDPSVANYTLKRVEIPPPNSLQLIFNAGSGIVPSPINIKFELTLDNGVSTRNPIELNNPIHWQDDPGDSNNLKIYQAVTVATGHILHYKSKFKADGYSLGNLLYSLPLAPGQKKEIVVFDNTHSLLASENQQITQREKVAAGITSDREITDQLGGNLNESLQGQSTSSTGGISAGGGLGYSYGGLGISLGVSGGTSTTDSSGSQNSAKDVSQFFNEKLRQTIMQNADSFRQLNASVITTVQENQKYSVTTEVVANHNHCHALTILYFEVLRHFAVYQELSSVEECVFVPFLMTNYTTENIYKWRDVLAPRLLPMPSNTYLSVAGFGGGFQHPLLKAFDANERIKTNYANVDFPADSYDNERISNIKGYITLRVRLDQPKTLYERIKTLPVISTQTDFGDFMARMGDALFGKNSASRPDMNDYVKVDPNFASVAPKDSVRPVKFDDKFFDAALSQPDRALWAAYAKLLGHHKPTDSENIADMLHSYFFGKLVSEWDDIFNNRIAPDLFKAILPTISFQKMNNGKSISTADFSTSERYTGGEKLIRVNFDGQTNIKRKEFDEYISLKAIGSLIQNLNDQILLNVETVQINYSTPHYHGTLFNGYSGNDLIDGTDLYIPENSDEKRNPKTEDIFLVNKLIEHLNSNLEYYNKTLWYLLDQDRRYMLLDGFSIEIYNDFGIKLQRSLASVVKNQLITVAGNSLVFPVAAGYKVGQSFITETKKDGSLEDVSLFDHYKPITPIEPYRISVPSRGVFAETLQSYCNACEKIEADRLQDWNKFPNTDEPTPIQPVNVPTPTVTDWKAAFKDFAQPIINIQNAPSEPAPGAGLAGLTDLLGKAGIFKDITGLDATQKAALQTYLSNQDNAKAFAEMAKELAMKKDTTEHSDKIADALNQAKDSKAITDAQHNQLYNKYLNNLVDGGASQKKQDEINSKKTETSPINAAVDLAKTRQGNFSATETTSEGSKTAEFKTIGDKTNLYDFVVPGTIEPIVQKTPNACWATVTTMMSNWKQHQSQSVNDYVNFIGAEFIPFIKTGITIEKLGDFCNKANLKMASTNTEYPVSFYYNILQKNGPIWVIDLESTDPKMLHGRLLRGIKGDDSSDSTMFSLIDPASGSGYDESLPTFMAKTENVIKTIDAVKDVQIPLLIFYEDIYDKSLYSSNTKNGNTVSIGESISHGPVYAPGITEKISTFKLYFQDNPTILIFGQFQIAKTVIDEVINTVDSDLILKPDSELQSIWYDMKNLKNNKDFKSLDLITNIKTRKLESTYPGIVKVYSSDSTATKAWAQKLYKDFWSGKSINPSPNVIPATVARFKAAMELGGIDIGDKPTGELGACFDSTKALAKKYISARYLQNIPANLKIPDGQITGSKISPTNDKIIFTQPEKLAEEINKIKKVIDKGYPVICGVLS